MPTTPRDDSPAAQIREQMPPSPWMLVERYVEHYPDDWRLVFRRGDMTMEVSVPEEVWRAFDS